MLQDKEQKICLAELQNFPDGPPETISFKSITLDITHRCNFNCPGCIERAAMQDSRHSSLMRGTVYNLIDVFSDLGIEEVSLYGGEPTVHPNFPEILQYIAQRIKKVRLITNGSRLSSPEIADAIIKAAEETDLQIRVSLNSGSEETHNRLHGVKGHFKDIIRGLELIGREGKVQLRISFILCEDNYGELADAYSITQNCNAAVFSIRAMTGPHGIRILPLSDKARSAALVAIKNLQKKSSCPRNPKLDVDREYICYLEKGCQPNTFKDYPDCYYCGNSRIIITPPDPGVAWACPYWRGDPRFKIAELAEAPLGSQKFELRRQEAIRCITPCLDCADVICNRHHANLAIYNQLNAIYKNEGLMAVI
jgi:MoaA/NifB/PqqE/SkfB family radical SAM enzyme